MANYFPAVIDELRTTIITAWPEIATNHRLTQIERVNWRDMVEKADLGAAGGIDPPWVVMDVGAATPDPTWGAVMETYRWAVSVYYIESTRGSTDRAAAIEAKLVTLRDALAAVAGFTNFVVVEEPILDVSAANPMNELFLEHAAPLMAGSVVVNLLVGEAAG